MACPLLPCPPMGSARVPPQGDPVQAARTAGLHYADDARPGITRRRAGRGFSYRCPDGRTVTGRAELARIRRLAVPPAWTHVWVAPPAIDHLWATVRAARGPTPYLS